ncbi:hypothetical protein BB559_001238 [Furculomyces boomerangus]|uniref:Enoyl-CoA hydratase n=2 Tax=Harpellales TaxID=61421 RepID=A0A2T9Z2N8_9FUNG|nr:hypothetical protein BB559_001238 [Furculomyces boomerangus]PWA00674.1 hypothetical protein BB558_003272 [Smittium angustum]
MTSILSKKFPTLALESPFKGVLHVILNRPEQLNAINPQMWTDLRECFDTIRMDGDVNSVVLSANGKLFCSGLDLRVSQVNKDDPEKDIARNAYYKRYHILDLQNAVSSIEKCEKPVICAINSACIGAGVDIVTACDIRYCSSDTFFSVKEVDIGMAADVGTLQRLPKVVGNDSWVRELAFTARRAYADEALQFGLVSKILKNKEETVNAAIKLASDIAEKSPVAVVSSKHILNYSRDHTVQEGLEYCATWNTLMHNTVDIKEAIGGFLQKRKPTFSKL